MTASPECIETGWGVSSSLQAFKPILPADLPQAKGINNTVLPPR